jgi:hypothetical protein
MVGMGMSAVRDAAESAEHSTQLQPTLRPWVLRLARRRAKVALLFAGLLLAASWAEAFSAWPAADTYRDAMLRGEDLAGIWTPYDTLALVHTAAALSAYVATALWLQRARANAELIRSFNHKRSPVWNWLGWWVPVVSVWFPFQIMRDLGRASSPSLSSPPALGVWWGLWLVGQGFSRAADRIAFRGYEAVGLLGPVNLVAAIAFSGAFVLWARMVLGITRLQEQVHVDDQRRLR